MPDPREVRSMFGRIAPRYDLLNHVLSLGIDRTWRVSALRVAGPLEGRRVIDACCGTGDLALAFAHAGARVLGVDFTPEMLLRARAKAEARSLPAAFVHADALHLPVASASAEIASVAFGLRNLADPDAGLRELARVLKPGGRLLVLEFSPPPRGCLGAAYRLYSARLLPLIGSAVSGDREAYRYLPRSVAAWPAPDEVRERIARAGLVDCGFESLSGGVASLHWGRRAS